MVAVEIAGTGLIPVSRVELVAPDGTRTSVHPSTVSRWVNEGLEGPEGQRIKLEVCRVGGRCYTTAEAIRKFLALKNGESLDVVGIAPAGSQR